MQLKFSWVELHGAITHFPIVFLLASVAADLVAVAFRQPEWRRAGLAMLIAAVVSSVPALLTGYFTGRGFGAYPPVGFQTHWIAAVSTSLIAALLLTWRLVGRDRLGSLARFGSLGVAALGAAAVSFTGYSGGQMVFGGAAPAVATTLTAASTPHPEDVATMSLASGNLGLAAERLGVAVDKLVFVAQEKKARAAAQAASQQAAQPNSQLNDVNSNLTKISAQLGSIANLLPSLAAKPDQDDDKLIPIDAEKPAPTGKEMATGKAPSKPKAPPAASAATISQGDKLFHSDAMSCISCHKVGPNGGAIGPDLTREGAQKRGVAWQMAHLRNPSSKVPGSRMPPFANVAPRDMNAIAAYLESLK